MSADRLRHGLEYLGVAAIATAADVGTVLLCRAQDLLLFLAVALGFAANVVVGFVLQRFFVFRGSRRTLRAATWRYGALVGSNVLIGVGGVTLVVEAGSPYLLARLVSSALIVALNYAALRWWVFPGASRIRA